METESKNIMAIYNLYKTFITNCLSNILEYGENFNEKLIAKYAAQLKHQASETSFARNNRLKNLIADRMKSLSVYNLNDETLTDAQRHEIAVMEKSGDIVSSLNFRVMARQLQIEKRLQRKEFTKHIKIIENMWAHIGNGYYFRNDETKLVQLFECAIDLFCVSSPLSWDRVDDETYNLIKAIKYLERYNIEYKITLGKVILSDNSHAQIYSRLESLVKGIGGIDTLRKLFSKELEPRYKKEVDRYFIHRNKSLTGKTKDFRRVPYNYLINICGKFLNNGLVTLTKLGVESSYNEIIDLSSYYLTALQLQGNSVYEDMFVTYEKLPEYIYNNIVFENLYIPVQYKPDFVLEILKKIYGPLFRASGISEFNFDQYYRVTSMLLEYKHCSVINFEDIRGKLGINRKILRNILGEISKNKDSVNNDYVQILTPSNLFEKPLIKISKDTYFMISPHFSGYSFCNAIHQMLRKARVPNLDRDIGDSIENYVKDSLDSRHIPYKSGHYSITNPEEKGQCDVVLETATKVVFLEIKKRSLPDEFKLGDDIEVLRSLGDGMIDAQKQMLCHRVYLQKNNFMKLYQEQKENSPHMVLEWNGRQIVSISMCLPDYGFLTNKTTSAKLLESLIFVTYHATDPAKERALDKLNKRRDKIAQLVGELRAEDKKDARTVFFDTLFRSIQQFMFALEMSSGVEELVDYLTRGIYLVDSSLDFYSSLYFEIKR
ncbi:MAG: hypothetical protein PHY90_03955 [Desulfitobacteriaceae bacterium]|nr:hypothetical protein [Desulfitobacteriaceae bacterium]